MPVFDRLADKSNVEKVEEISANRQDAARGRLRTKSKNGEEIIINLPRGQSIGQGDVFGPSAKGLYYKIQIEPEPVIKVNLNEPQAQGSLENAIRLGYNLGNRHLEVLIEGDTVFVPVTLGEEKVKKMVESMKLPVKLETVQKVISASDPGYHPGEQEEE